jgi:uncharacterized membrane protein YbjE (DUF340 family)
MITGIFLGFLFKKKRTLINAADKLAGLSIYLLLFLLGLSIGNNEIIVSNFARIGFTSLILTISGITGSVFFSFLTYKYFFMSNEDL